MSQAAKPFGWRLTGWAGRALPFAAAMVIASSIGASAQSGADMTKIVVGIANAGTGQLPTFIALQEGFFKKEGLDVVGQQLNGGTAAAMAAFVGGNINVLNLSGPELISSVGKKIIAGKAFGEMIDKNLDLVVGKSIASIKDIEGKTIGISGPNGSDQIFLVGLMAYYGISARSVTFITIGGSSLNRFAAIESGTIQVSAQTISQREQSNKTGKVLLKAEDSPVQFPSNVFVASDELIKNHKPLLKKFLAALSGATAWMRANQDAAVADCVKALGASADECKTAITLYFDRSLSSEYTWSSTYAISVEGLKSAFSVMALIDPGTKGLTIDDVADLSIAGTTP